MMMAGPAVESMEGDMVVIGNSGNMSLSDGGRASSPIPMTFGDTTMTGITRFEAGRGLRLGTEGTVSTRMTTEMDGQPTVANTVAALTLELVED